MIQFLRTSLPLIAAAVALAIVLPRHPQAAAPAVVFTKGFAGSGFENPLAIAVDGDANIYVTGSTTSSDLPVSSNAFQKTFASAFVAKLNARGDLVWLTYLGGRTRRYPLVSSHAGPIQAGQAIAVDGAGYVYVAGYTGANDFPTRNALQVSPGNSYQDAFVTKLNPTGSDVVYSTYLGGPGTSATAEAIAVTPMGEAVVGLNASDRLTFETRDLSAQPGSGDMVVLKLNPAGGRIFAARLGGTAHDVLSGLAVDAAGAVHIAGAADSADFPTVNALIRQCPLFSYSCQAGFAAKLDPSGTRFLYSTYVGAAGGLTRATAIAATVAGGSVVAGETAASDFQVSGAAQPVRGGSDAFVLTLSAAGTLVSSTLVGGAGADAATTMAPSPAAGVAMVGTTNSGDFPSQQSLIPRHPDGPLFTSVDAAASWAALGPMLGGDVTALTIAQTGPPIMYAGTGTGLFRSADGGGTWESIFDDVPQEDRRPVMAIAVDPRQPATIYAGNFAGVFKTVDAGARWAKIDPASVYTASIAVDGEGIVFLGDKGIRKSRDGGLTWTNSSTGLPLLVTGQLGAIDQFAFDPNRAGVLYALYSGTIYRTTDGGDRWTRVEIQDPRQPGFGVTIRAIAVPPGQPGRVYAGGYFGIFRSDDDGATWRAVLPQVLGLALGVNAQHPNTVYAVTSGPAVQPISVSRDAGQTWSNAAGGVTAAGAGVHLLATDPRNGDRVLSAAYMRSLPFVTVLTPDASALVFSTLLSDGGPRGIARDVSGDLYVLLSQQSRVAVTKISLSGR